MISQPSPLEPPRTLRLPLQLAAAEGALAMPPTSAPKRGHGHLLAEPGQVTPFVHRTTYFSARIPVFGGGAGAHAALYNASGPRSASAP